MPVTGNHESNLVSALRQYAPNVVSAELRGGTLKITTSDGLIDEDFLGCLNTIPVPPDTERIQANDLTPLALDTVKILSNP